MIVLRIPNGEKIVSKKIIKKWKYTTKQGKAVDAKTVKYIEGLVIPPAYRDVQIFVEPAPKILYTGFDDKDRPQSIYSPAWARKARSKKLCSLVQFAKKYPTMIADMKSQIQATRPTKNRVISVILRIISLCYFRIGNVKYEKLYKSHGISTITPKHIKFIKLKGKPAAHIQFIGKKAVHNECFVVDPDTLGALRGLVQSSRGGDSHLFVYKDMSSNEWKHITHLDVNNWLKKYDPIFTSKLFRTLDTNVLIIKDLSKKPPNELKESARKKNIREVLKVVSGKVHNTPAICKKDYSDPNILEIYVSKPRAFTKHFVTPKSDSRILFINYMKSRCR
jgi:DNA topoisomerase-1